MASKLTDMAKGTKFIRMAQCGVSGVGKTCIASTFPKPLYFADMEEGVKSLLAYYDYDQKKLDGIEYDTYLDSDPKKPDAYRRLNDKLANMKGMSAFPYATVVIDSLTTLEDRVMNEVIRDVQTKRVRNKVANQQDYGLVIWDLEEFIQNLLTLPCNVVLNCHTQIVQNEITREILTLPLVVGKKLPQKLPLWMDEYYSVGIKDGKRQWQIRPGGMIQQAKTRMLPKSTPDFIDADYASLAKYLGT